MLKEFVLQSAGPERGKKYTFWKFHLLVVTLNKEEVLVSNSKVWSTLYNQCIRQSINRCGKKELVSTVRLTPPILRKVSQVSHRVLLQELKFTTTFNVIHVLYLFLLLLLFVFTAVARRLKQALFIHSFIHSFYLPYIQNLQRKMEIIWD